MDLRLFRAEGHLVAAAGVASAGCSGVGRPTAAGSGQSGTVGCCNNSTAELDVISFWVIWIYIFRGGFAILPKTHD